MRTLALLYHDVVTEGRYGDSGFQSPDANIYKLDRTEFARHLEAIARASRRPPVTAGRLGSEASPELLLTFDDGGASALEPVAGMLAGRGWKAHFFVTSDYVGTPGFLTPGEIRELHRQGHVIGSHSASHPLQMGRCPREQLDREWRRSTAALAEILGEPVRTASIPGGYYSHAVADSAAAAGIRTLFTSEPVTRPWTRDGCTMLGRFGVQQGVPPEWVAAVVAGRVGPRLSRYCYWNAKKLVKAAGGEQWLKLRAWMLARR